MKYPKIWAKIVNAFALASGALTLVIAALSVIEAVMRYVFNSPTSWSLTVCTYILLYVVFFASPYAFQEGGHVAVDMVRIGCDKIDKSGRLRRVISVIGYIFALVFMYVLAKGTYQLLEKAVAGATKTLAKPVIPMWALYGPMLIGLILMMITLVFMILDCVAKDSSGKYL
ncbi:MAG: TRAP transporter small permease [Oscillospiraceae bacterium]